MAEPEVYMPHKRVERVSDVVEIHWENAFIYWFTAILLCAGSALSYRYFENYGLPLAGVLGALGFVFFVRGLLRIREVRRVTSIAYTCPFCEGTTELTDIASSDFACIECHRMVPVEDGEVMAVHLVRCGYCSGLNYYTDKSEYLICEECNHEIPIHVENPTGKAIPKYLVASEDDALYELVLTGYSPGKAEDLIACMQRILAINRNQVKGILEDLPSTLLTGIVRQKAEMLKMQLALYDGEADARPLV
jgi:hypothetical protein